MPGDEPVPPEASPPEPEPAQVAEFDPFAGETAAAKIARVARRTPEFGPDEIPAPVFPVPGAPNAVVAALLSLALPGAGQFYAGQRKKGVATLVVALLTCSGAGILNLVAATDAYLVAERRERGETLSPWKFF